jgi:Tfp pilus assembly protein PilO
VTSRRQIAIAVAAAIGITILFFLLLIKPKLNDISTTRADVQAAEQQHDTLELQLAHLREIQKNAPATIDKLAKVSQYLPSTPDLPGFIRLVQDAATTSGVDLQSIAPSPPTDLTGSSGVQTISVTLTLRAGFFRLEDFLARLEGLQRAVEVRSIAMAPSETELSNQVVLATTITLQMYVVQQNASASSGTTVAPRPSASATVTP